MGPPGGLAPGPARATSTFHWVSIDTETQRDQVIDIKGLGPLQLVREMYIM